MQRINLPTAANHQGNNLKFVC